ncbi:hypothetical protein [Bdellovibrio sp. HCB337]|uniref:hypothetical protein n=1 Tax=Bdellovibrio sp. HCB337 TaxID=3394358 RepID=UPI0039A5DF60
MYAVIRHYRIDKRHNNEIDQKIRDSFTQIIEKAPGFVSYHWVNSGDGNASSISVFEDKAQAQDSNRLAAKFVKETLSKLGVGSPIINEGIVQAHTERVARSRQGKDWSANQYSPPI